MQTRVSHGIVRAPSGAVTAHNCALSYVRGAVVSPLCISVAVFAGCAGVGLAGVLGAVVAFVIVVVFGAYASRYPIVRRHLDRQAQATERCRREAARTKQLRPAGPVRLQQYVELRQLVEDIERSDASEAARFELQDLLEHFIQLAVSQQRCVEALRLVGNHDPSPALSTGDTSRSTTGEGARCSTTHADAKRSNTRREIRARRMRHREACLARIDHLGDELEAVDELIRLVAQRVACPTLELDVDREINRRLWELDEVDHALGQLSA